MAHIHKKNLIVSYKSLSDTLRELFKNTYPEGYGEYLQKTIKPNGDPMFFVPLETEDTNYLVRFDVKIDSGMVEEDDNEAEDKAEEEGEFAPLSEVIDKEEGRTSVRGLLHGADVEDMVLEASETPSRKKSRMEDAHDEYGDEAEDGSEDESDMDKRYADEDEEDEMTEPDGPSDEDLAEIEKMERELLTDNLADLTSMPLKKMGKEEATAVAVAGTKPKAKAKKASAQTPAKAASAPKGGAAPKPVRKPAKKK